MTTKLTNQLDLPLAYSDNGKWFVPVRPVKIDDKNTLLKTGRPVQTGTCYQIAKELGISRRILKKLSLAGFIQSVKPTPYLTMYYYSEVASFLEKTRTDPHFWTQVRKTCYDKDTPLPPNDSAHHSNPL